MKHEIIQAVIEGVPYGTKITAACLRRLATEVSKRVPWEAEVGEPTTWQLDPQRPWDKSFPGYGWIYVSPVDRARAPSICIRIKGRRRAGRGWVGVLAERVLNIVDKQALSINCNHTGPARAAGEE